MSVKKVYELDWRFYSHSYLTQQFIVTLKTLV